MAYFNDLEIAVDEKQCTTDFSFNFKSDHAFISQCIDKIKN